MIGAFLREIFGISRQSDTEVESEAPLGFDTELKPEVQQEFVKVREAVHHLNNEATKLRATVRMSPIALAERAIRVAKRENENVQSNH